MSESVCDRFLRYVRVPSQSNPRNPEVPSSSSQWDMARLLASELEELGLQQVCVSEHACVTAILPATSGSECSSRTSVGFVAHIDTADAGLSPEVKPQVVPYYQGGSIVLPGTGEELTPQQFPVLENYRGQDIVTTDGTSVLGSDDKAGVAAIMNALQEIVEAGTAHADVYVAFVPDEEIGLRGAQALDLHAFSPEYAYTIDGGEIGELVYETFNAAEAHIHIEGVSAHPMDAKDVLVNPVLVALDFVGMFDRTQTPECTEMREGYHWINAIDGNVSVANVQVNIRDHDRARFEWRKRFVQESVERVQALHPRAVVTLEMHDQYANILDSLTPENQIAIDRAREVFADMGIEPLEEPMRGGTDGSYLSTQGLFTPNLFTGGHNFHSKFEFLPVGSLEKSSAVIRALIERA